MKAYHFTCDKLRDGRPIPAIGEWLVHDGELVPCDAGLHASAHPFDALKWAPGPLLHFVEIKDYVNHGSPVDKVCGRRRKILATIDATDLLRDFARWCALQVVHLWDAPEIVIDFLNTGDESKREAAGAAAWEAATKKQRKKFAEMCKSAFAEVRQ